VLQLPKVRHIWAIASNLSVACGVGPITCTRIVQKSEPFFNTDMLQLPAGRRRESTSLQLSGLQACEARDAKEEVSEDTENYNWKDMFLKLYHPNFVLRSGASMQFRAKEATTSM
jgi:hypothetical protein